MSDEIKHEISTRQALEIAAVQFRKYEAHHRDEADKINPHSAGKNDRLFGDLALKKSERNTKAHANRLMAEMCEQAARNVIAPPAPQEVRILGSMVMLSYANMNEAVDAVDEIRKVFARREAQQEAE